MKIFIFLVPPPRGVGVKNFNSKFAQNLVFLYLEKVSSCLGNKRLNIEMTRARECCLEEENGLPSREQLADPLTKKTADVLELEKIFQEGKMPRRQGRKRRNSSEGPYDS